VGGVATTTIDVADARHGTGPGRGRPARAAPSV